MLDIEKIINSFEIIPSNKANIILSKNMLNSGEKKILYVFAGPNGSGKSTLIANIYKSGMLKDVKYINADIYARTLFKNIEDEKDRNYQAMFYTMDKIKENIASGDSVVYETVMSHVSKLDIIKDYKNNGYKVFSVFISPRMPEVNIVRVAKRVKEGGHNVAEEKIRQRFYRSNELKSELAKLSDCYYEIDNTYLPEIKQNGLENKIM